MNKIMIIVFGIGIVFSLCDSSVPIHLTVKGSGYDVFFSEDLIVNCHSLADTIISHTVSNPRGEYKIKVVIHDSTFYATLSVSAETYAVIDINQRMLDNTKMIFTVE